MKTRKCMVFVDGVQQKATFHEFGGDVVYGSDNEPRHVTIAIVELADGSVKNIPPDSVKFLDKPE